MSCCDDADCHQTTQEHEHHAGCNHGQDQVENELSEEEQLRLKNERIARRRNQNLQKKKKYLPLLKFLKKHGLKIKTAAVQKNSVQYFRMDQFRALLKAKQDLINANQAIKGLLDDWEELFIYYSRVQNQPKFKWPQQLALSQKGPSSKFASFPFDSTQSSKLKSTLILLVVIGLVLFPLWPYELKYFVWLVSYYSTILLVGIIILRWVAYLFCSIFGASFWIFPRLFDNVEFIESFKPFCSLTWWESSIYSIVTRILIFSIFVYYGYHIYTDPSIIKQNIQITKTIMDDLNDWGVSKIKGERNFSQSALSDYSKLINSTDIAHEDDDKIVGLNLDEEQF